MQDLYDIIIVGAGPAGTAAALQARRRDASVLLVDRATFPRSRNCTGWLGPASIAFVQDFNIRQKSLGAGTIAGLRMHSWDLRSSVDVTDDEINAWVVDRDIFDKALLDAAVKAGADCETGVEPVGLALSESHAALDLGDGRTASGRVLLIGDGTFSQTARFANLPSAGETAGLPQSLFVEFETSDRAERLDIAIGASRAGQIATLVRHGKRGRLAIMTRERDTPLAEQFISFRDAATESGLLQGAQLGDVVEGHSPAGVALDMDTHVGKRCLLIGDAGGFVSAFSNEGLYPAMRSGCIAADVTVDALQADVLQDALAAFGTAWRSDLADHLRMPNTDLALLMPLVFKNEQMSRRVARAFLLGQQF